MGDKFDVDYAISLRNVSKIDINWRYNAIVSGSIVTCSDRESRATTTGTGDTLCGDHACLFR